MTWSASPPPSETGSGIDGFANLDASARYASVCLGGVVSTGSVNLKVTGIPSWFGSSVRAIVESAPWTNKDSVVTQTTLVSTSILAVSGSAVTVPLTGLNKLSGYRVILVPSPSAPLAPSSGTSYRLVNLNSGKVLGLGGSSVVLGSSAVQSADTGTSDHRWTLTASGTGFTLGPSGSTLVLGASDTGAVLVAGDGSSAQRWALTDTGSGVYQVVSGTGKTLGIADLSSLDGAVATLGADTGTADQRWVLVPAE